MNFFLRQTEHGRQGPAMTPARRRKLIFSYLPDWILTILLGVIFFSLDKVSGFKRVFSVEDTSLRHPYTVNERVPNIALAFICFVVPLITQPIINFITIRSWWDLHNSSLGLVLGLAMTGSITQFTKITVGRPRPDVIDRCRPPSGTVDPTFGLSSVAICTQTDFAILEDGFRSFPSGHSSLSFAGLGFLAFYLAGKLHLFDRRGHTFKPWLSLAPFSGAALIAISRTMDYRHHWHDVLVGSLLGTVVAYFSYRLYYPSLSSELSHRPYSPRIKREDILPLHEERPPSIDTSSHSHAHKPQLQGQTYYNPFPSSPIQPVNEALLTDHNRHRSDDYQLEGTVRRPDVGPLEEVWKDGEHEFSDVRSVPQRPEVAHGEHEFSDVRSVPQRPEVAQGSSGLV